MAKMTGRFYARRDFISPSSSLFVCSLLFFLLPLCSEGRWIRGRAERGSLLVGRLGDLGIVAHPTEGHCYQARESRYRATFLPFSFSASFSLSLSPLCVEGSRARLQSSTAGLEGGIVRSMRPPP